MRHITAPSSCTARPAPAQFTFLLLMSWRFPLLTNPCLSDVSVLFPLLA